ncbi:hypothetical protein BDP27DRAFT_1492989, partial [Rhodocollybia butyracea]
NRAKKKSDHENNLKEECYADGKLREAPTILLAQAAVIDLLAHLKGEPRGKSGGYKHAHIDFFTREKLKGMRSFLKLYTDPGSKTYGQWRASSLQAAITLGRGTYCARQLRILARAYIWDHKLLPNNPYGQWTTCMLADEDLVNEINLYLQELGNKITAEKLIQYLARPDVIERHSIDKMISVRTARRYLNTLNYRFALAKKGQYKDGHERPDVVRDRDKRFIPKMQSLLLCAQMFDKDGYPLPPLLLKGNLW